MSVPRTIAYFFLIGLPAGWLAHRMWWPKTELQLSFLMPNWEGSCQNPTFWYKDLDLPGKMHIPFIAFQLAIFLGYVFHAPVVPEKVVWQTCAILFIYFPLGIVQPGLIENKYITMEVVRGWLGQIGTFYLLTIIVSMLKLYNH
jgi:hypothetical protein